MKNRLIDIENLREIILMSEFKVWGVVSQTKRIGKTYIAKQIVECLSRAGKKIAFLSVSKEGIKDVITEKKLWDSNKCLEEVVYSDEFKQMLEEFRKKYDYIIIDMLSLEESSIGKKIAQLCDNNFFVVAKDIEYGEDIAKAVCQLQKLGITLAGIVLNEYHNKKMLFRM